MPSNRKTPKAKTPKAKPAPKTNPWIAHVGTVRAKNPDSSYKEVLVKAKATYKKNGKTAE